MIKIHLISAGKTKEKWLQDAISELEKRMSTEVRIESSFVKDDKQLIKCVEKEKFVICLDPQGQLLDSPCFAHFLHDELKKRGSRLTFMIGGPEGIPDSVRVAHPLISLSQLTFTHQICRLLLIEQIYRAWTLWRGLPYHK